MNPWCCAQASSWAATVGQLHTVMVLAKNGANIEQANGAGFNTQSEAEHFGYHHVVQWVDDWRSVGSPPKGVGVDREG